MDEMHRLIEKYKRELMEYSKAAAPQKPLEFPEMIPDALDTKGKQTAKAPEPRLEQPIPQSKPEPTPQPQPEPTPQPKLDPTPQSKPEPTPQPQPEPMSQPKPEPTPQSKPEPTSKPKPEPMPQLKPEPIETERPKTDEKYPDISDFTYFKSPEPRPTEGKRKPEIIGYVGSSDALSEYGNVISDLIPTDAETSSGGIDRVGQNPPLYNQIPSKRENTDSNTANSVAGDNELFGGEISGVTDNNPAQSVPKSGGALEVSPERADGLSRQPVSGTNPEEQLTGRNFEDSSLTQRSRDDIKPINSGELPVYTEQNYSDYEDFAENNPGTGQLRFLVFTARGALPIKGAICEIRKTISGTSFPLYSLITDESGQTEIAFLPAPPASMSQTPSEGAPPYSVYDATIHANGYDTVYYKNIPIFSGILSVQRTAMVPSSGASEQQSGNNGGV